MVASSSGSRVRDALLFLGFIATGSFITWESRGWFETVPKNVILFTLDTFRNDHLGPQGSPSSPSDTPFLDSLTHRGVRFSTVYSSCNNTMPSHVSILTSLHVSNHGVTSNRPYGLSERVRTLAHTYREQGYFTGAAVSNTILTPEYLAGIERGFEQFSGPEGKTVRRGEETLAAALEMLGPAIENRRPFFLWIHLFEPHFPYEAPAPFVPSETGPPSRDPIPLAKEAFPKFWWDLGWTHLTDSLASAPTLEKEKREYRGEVGYTDSLVARFCEALDRRGEIPRTFFAITADHGESLGERQVYFDHVGGHDPVLRVPLILYGPSLPRGLVVETPISTLDLAPTLLELTGLEPEPEMKGHSLLPRIRDPQATPGHPVFATMHDGILSVVRLGPHKLTLGRRNFDYTPSFSVLEGQVELFQIEEDPEERRDLSEKEPAVRDRLLELVRRFVTDQQPLGETSPRKISRSQRKALRELGYSED